MSLIHGLCEKGERAAYGSEINITRQIKLKRLRFGVSQMIYI